MKDFFKNKFATVLVVVATVILAGVAIFTAMRLYQLRQESVSPGSPESEPKAWDCSKYTFSVSQTGAVTATNQSNNNEPAQQAKVYINGSLAATLNVPALAKGQTATLGNVQVPSGGFSWRVEGTDDCTSSGASAEACQLLTFNISTPTLTPTGTITITPTHTPTETPIGGVSDTPTPTETSTPTSSPSPTPTLPPPPSITEAPNCPASKPEAPTIISVVKNESEVTLTWSSVSNATHYVISYGTTANNLAYGVPNTGNVTTYTIKSLNPSSTYYFTVYAVNDCMPSEGSAILGSGTQGEELPLPKAGISLPTLFGLTAGALMIVFALLLAL